MQEIKIDTQSDTLETRMPTILINPTSQNVTRNIYVNGVNIITIDDIDIINDKDAQRQDTVYNAMWNMQSDGEWGQNRIIKYWTLLFNSAAFLSNTVVLDACCGMGRFSLASLELGAKQVYAFDKSFNALKQLQINVNNVPYTILKRPITKIKPVCGDIENITDIFAEETFDVIIHNMSLHHTSSFKKTLKNLHTILHTGGILAFNFFKTGTTHPVVFKLREIFKDIDVMTTLFFLKTFNLISLKTETLDFENFIYNKVDTTQLITLQQDLNKLEKEYSVDTIRKHMNNFEDLKTDYLYNFEKDDVFNYVVNDLKMKALSFFETETQVGIVSTKMK